MTTLLNYPFNPSIILKKKKKIKSALLSSDKKFHEVNIAILGGSTTSEIKNILELFLLKNDIKANFYESEYNKFYEDSLFPNDELDKFNPDFIYIHTTNVNISTYPSVDNSSEEIDLILKRKTEKFKSIWNSLQKYKCAIIQNNFELPLSRNLGNLDSYDIHGHTHFITMLNLEFAQNARDIKNLYISDINYLSSFIGLEKWFDKHFWYSAKYAVSFEAIPHLSHNLAKIINAILGKTKKCLVLDLDNTCWGGVIGDDGLDGISIGNETAVAESFTAFQKYVKELRKRGITLAVCSKNDLNNAKEGFSHPDSILKLDDFTSFKANWDPKHENILDIAKEINIGIDSLVFIDDNPVERDIVSSQVSFISVPDVGEDVVNFIDHIDRNGYFEVVTLSNDDLNRNKYYEDNKKRSNEQATYKNYDEFLISLDMQAEIKTFSSLYLERITQLTNKTNQFNLTTKRYIFSEMEAMVQNDDYIKIYGRLIDKYGDNGLIALSIGRIKNEQCHIDLWLMSCRVLKRDMEFAMLDNLIYECIEKGVFELIGYYYKTAKNNMVANMYKSFGFELLEINSEDTIWKLDLRTYKNKNKFIKVKND